MKNINSVLSHSSKTILMGILNITPDSFSDGGMYFENIEAAVARGVQMVEEGADIIDIGGESTRPGAHTLTAEEEIYRIIPVISELRDVLGSEIFISVDTNKAQVADEALSAGADIINSLGGFSFDSSLATICAEYACPVVLYHIKGEPYTMQEGDLEYSVMEHVENFFRNQISVGIENGMNKHQFILDPGIGFGKSVAQNLELIAKTNEFLSFGAPICIGVSRKSHLGKLLQQELDLPEIPDVHSRLEGALAETAVAVTRGARIVRTHDVAPTKRFLTVLDTLL